ncbi:MAG TPA: hypothetical protein VFA26_10685 [Gemmataceae bacterium]|nr:hypothetical protein [Gemmataceae bacterium]
MTRAKKALVILVVTIFGVWGCSQGPTHSAASLERIKALEGKCAKLEDDYRAVAAARDQLKKKLAQAESDRARAQQELNQSQAVARERDELRQQLAARTGERDAVQTQFDNFRKGIRNLLGQVEAATPPAGQPAVSAAERPAGGQS